MCLVTVSAFTENVMISEKDSSMFIEMNVSLLVVLFCGGQNGGWGVLSLRLSKIEKKVQARRSGNVTVLTDKNMGLIWPFSRLRKTSKIGPGWVLFIWYLF